MTAQPSSIRPAPPLLSLQVLRAAAALLVVVHHAGYDADTVAARIGLSPLALGRWFDGTFGIHLFFVISGFIMLRTARGFGSARGAAAFALRRILRVVPLYWLLTTLTLVGGALAPALLNQPAGGGGVVLGSYLFIPVTRPDGELRPVLGQGWTLDYEMFFYALFALAMLLPRRAALGALAAVLVSLVAVGRVIHPSVSAVAVWTNGLLLEFLFGMALGLAQERGWRLGRSAAAVLLLGGIAALSMGPMPQHVDALAPWVGAGLPAAAVVGGCVLGPRWPATRPLAALALVGDASYSLYLSHPFVVRLMRSAWLAARPDGALWCFMVLAILGAVGASLLLYRWVERPMTRWLQRRIGLLDVARRPILPDIAVRGTLPRA